VPAAEAQSASNGKLRCEKKRSEKDLCCMVLAVTEGGWLDESYPIETAKKSLR
jgi:hypothetical protein